MGVSIREKRGKLYLDIIHNGQRYWESLGLTLPSDEAQRAVVMRLAEVCKSKREIQILSEKWNLNDKGHGEQTMTATVLRKEIHTIIDAIPDESLPAVKPLLTYLADAYWKPVIEPASPEEAKKAEKIFKEYEKDLSSFVPFKKRVNIPEEGAE
jgi:hypothetical protein